MAYVLLRVHRRSKTVITEHSPEAQPLRSLRMEKLVLIERRVAC
jgi:hypothetical protein